MAEYLANSVRGYGFGYSAAEALGVMASHARHDAGDGTLEVQIVQYEVDANMTVYPGGFRCDGEVEHVDVYELTDEQIDEIADLSGELDLLVDRTLADAPKVEDD